MPNRYSIAIAVSSLLFGSGLAAQESGRGQQDKPAGEEALFGDLPTVEAVALHAQTLAEAPASVSVITAAEIRRYGYRTLAEALASVRGFYVTSDHDYHYVGVRGISLPGDFNTRFLVMLNGHPLTDNIYDSSGFFGQDFGLDLDLVERIEIVRGPTSALYGSNGMLANINVVTRSPVDGPKLRLSSETASGGGERKLSLASSLYLGRGANLLVSASGFNNGGLDFPGSALGLGQPIVSNADGERGYHSFANLIWHGWSFTGYFNSRRKQPPLGAGTSLSGDPGQQLTDGRGLMGLSYKRQLGPGELQWHFSWDRYRYNDRFDYPAEDGISAVRDVNRGDWLDSQLSYQVPLGGVGPFTAGLAGSWDILNQQYNIVDGRPQPSISNPDRGLAVFAQQEWHASPRWTLAGGARLDLSRDFPTFVSPRMAAVYQPSRRTAYKFVYGRPFRNPSSFEQYYNDGGLSYLAAPRLHAEAANTFEASLEREVAPGAALVVNAFHYRIGDVIDTVALNDAVLQYRNYDRLRSTGIEAELSGRLRGGIEAKASAVFQGAVRGTPLTWLANSPHQVHKMRLGLPLLHERLFVSGSMQYLSSRLTVGGDRLPGPWLADFTATARVHPALDLVAGMRNAFAHRYEDPVNLALDRLRGDGRGLFLKLVWRPIE